MAAMSNWRNAVLLNPFLRQASAGGDGGRELLSQFFNQGMHQGWAGGLPGTAVSHMWMNDEGKVSRHFRIKFYCTIYYSVLRDGYTNCGTNNNFLLGHPILWSFYLICSLTFFIVILKKNKQTTVALSKSTYSILPTYFKKY